MSEVDSAVPEMEPAGIGAPVQDEIPEDSSTSQDAPETTDTTEKPLGGVAKRIKELTQLRYEADERARRAEARADQLLQQQLRQPEPEPAADPLEKPKLENFASYEDYTEAVADWKFETKLQQREAQSIQERQVQAEQSRLEQFEQRAQSFSAEADDWNAVVRTMPLSQATFEAAQESELGPQLLYHIGKNPQLAQEFYNLSPRQAALRLGRLEVEISQPKPKTVSGAPPPINPLSGGQVGGIVDDSKLTGDQWLEKRYEELRMRQTRK